MHNCIFNEHLVELPVINTDLHMRTLIFKFNMSFICTWSIILLLFIMILYIYDMFESFKKEFETEKTINMLYYEELISLEKRIIKLTNSVNSEENKEKENKENKENSEEKNKENKGH